MHPKRKKKIAAITITKIETGATALVAGDRALTAPNPTADNPDRATVDTTRHGGHENFLYHPKSLYKAMV